jgi:uncharacterized membrane protein YhaH (DUF805 family)
MAIIEQCNRCGRGLGNCPFYSQEEIEPCQNYLKPIDNSGFFSHFFSPKGRIGRIQYLVTVLIACAIWVLSFMICSMVDSDALQNQERLILLLTLIPCVILIILAGIKRSHDLGEDGWYIFNAFTNFNLYCKEGDEGLNAYGSEPLEPFDDQIIWQQGV